MTVPPASHSFLINDEPLGFAHRGGVEVAPENSIAAFAAAVDTGLHYLETDVHLSVDGVVVAAHDERLDRVADTGGEIASMTWREISTPRLGGTEPIPTFEELLDAFPDQRFNVDPKSDEVLDPLLDLLVRMDAVDRVCIAAFSQPRIQRVRDRFANAICTAAGPREITRAVARARLGVRRVESGPESASGEPRNVSDLPYACLQIPLRHKGVAVLTPRLVEWAHRHGAQVHVWTINDASEMSRLLDLGVDGIMTDLPSVLRAELDRRGDAAESIGPSRG